MQEKKNDKSKIVARVLVICAAALIVPKCAMSRLSPDWSWSA